MKMFAKWLSALLIVGMLLSTVAFMEEELIEDISLKPTVEEYTSENDENISTERINEVCAKENEADNVDATTDDEDIDNSGNENSDEVGKVEEEILPDPIDETVEEEAFDLPVYDTQVTGDNNAQQEYAIADGIVDVVSSDPMAAIIGIPIDEEHFPDESFRKYVYEECYKGQKDYILTEDEVKNKVEFDAQWCLEHSDRLPTDLTGIQYFHNLKKINCRNCKLTSLDLSGLIKLQEIDCSYNKLISLKLDECRSLRKLYCNYNQLTKLIFPEDSVMWQELHCDHNNLTSLDISNCGGIYGLWCQNNRLKTLNLGNKTLFYLHCESNRLTQLDISGGQDSGHYIKEVYCSNNQLSTIKFGKHETLMKLCCEKNKITTLDITGFYEIIHYIDKKYYSLSTDKKYVSYDSHEQGHEITLSCDSYVRIIGGDNPVEPIPTPIPTSKPTPTPKPTLTEKPTATPAPAHNPALTPVPVPTAVPVPIIPTISATKKNSKTTITAAPGSVYQLDLGGATGKKFKSSKKKVATVSGTGLVTIKGAGKTKITFKVGKKKRTVTLTVKDPTVPGSVTLNVPTTAVKKGDVITLTANLPAGTNSAIKWTSSNKKVATVNNGVVTFKKKGKVTITATAVRGKKKAKVKFRVSK